MRLRIQIDFRGMFGDFGSYLPEFILGEAGIEWESGTQPTLSAHAIVDMSAVDQSDLRPVRMENWNASIVTGDTGSFVEGHLHVTIEIPLSDKMDIYARAKCSNNVLSLTWKSPAGTLIPLLPGTGIANPAFVAEIDFKAKRIRQFRFDGVFAIVDATGLGPLATALQPWNNTAAFIQLRQVRLPTPSALPSRPSDSDPFPIHRGLQEGLLCRRARTPFSCARGWRAKFGSILVSSTS